MSKKATAPDSALGYYYQSRYALLLLIRPNLHSMEISIETFDDISFEKDGKPIELIQTKQHSSPKDLTDKSVDLWKTIGNWSSAVKDGTLDLSKTMLTLVTTSTAPEGSAANMLRPNGPNRDTLAALKQLQKEGKESTNPTVISNYSKFEDLGPIQQQNLIEKINIIDNAPNIEEVKQEIFDHLSLQTPLPHLEDMFQRIEGWWINEVVKCLKKQITSISRSDLQNYIVGWRDQYRQDALTIYNIDGDVEKKISFGPHDERNFVKQLRLVKLQNLIKDSQISHLRALTHRIRWVRKNSAVIQEILDFDKTLQKEWRERFNDKTNDITDLTHNDVKVQLGRDLFRWANFESQDLKLRNQSGLHFYTKGVFQILSDKLTIGWHPDYEKILKNPNRNLGGP